MKGFRGIAGYSATKFAIRGFSEALRANLKEYNISVSVVYPYITKTPMANQLPVQYRQMKAHNPDVPAKAILKSVIEEKDEVIVGLKSRLLYNLNRIAPWVVNRIIEAS